MYYIHSHFCYLIVLILIYDLCVCGYGYSHYIDNERKCELILINMEIIEKNAIEVPLLAIGVLYATSI